MAYQHFSLFTKYFQKISLSELYTNGTVIFYLTFYNTIQTFNGPEKVAFWKHLEKGENAGKNL